MEALGGQDGHAAGSGSPQVTEKGGALLAPTAAPAAAGAQPPLGRLEPVRLRDYWKDEAHDFTPWLAKPDNLSLLSETIGMNLELVGREQRIGPFRADIIARDEERRVVVENQLDVTDHKHLGQLLVYAADREAHTVVWIARQVSDEYRKVIDWLNTETSTNFWALEIELWCIGDSAVAPKFNVVCEPNELTKTKEAGESEELTGVRVLQLEFWSGFAEYVDNRESSFNSRKARAQNWYSLSIGTTLAYISLTILVRKSGRIGCELYMPGRMQADLVFERLKEDQEAIKSELAGLGTLDWQDLPDRKACRIVIYRDDVNLEDKEQWPEFYAWLLERSEAFKQTFADRLKNLDLPEPEDAAIVALQPALTHPRARHSARPTTKRAGSTGIQRSRVVDYRFRVRPSHKSS